jgi:putative copper export protein
VVLSLLVSYPLAFIFRKVPSGGAKHVFSAAVGVALMQWVYGADWAHSFITSMLTYVLCIVCPRSIVPYVVFFAIMGYLVGTYTCL